MKREQRPTMQFRLAELLAALSLVTDLGMGQPAEEATRACLLATGLARKLNLAEAEVAGIYYTTLLKYLGCTAYAHEEAAFFGGDDIALRSSGARVDFGNPREALPFVLFQPGRAAPLPRRLQIVARALAQGAEFDRQLDASHCEVAAMLARRLGLPENVQRSLYQVMERWDGKGGPQRLAKDGAAPAARFALLASRAVIFARIGGPELASAIFILIAQSWHAPWPRGRAAAGAAIYGLLAFGTSYALLYYALLGLAAGKVAVIVATVPLFTLAIAVLFGQERLSVRGIIGSVMVISGIAVLSLGTLGGAISSTYLLAAILGAIAIAASSVLVKTLPNVHPVSLNAIGMAAGTLLLALGSLLLGERWALPRETPTLLAVAWLVLLGSLGLFQLFLYVIRRWSASATVYAVAGMPVVAAGLGTLMLGQPVTVEVAVGGMLVIAAVYVGAIARARTLPDVPLPEGATLMTEASSEEPATP